MAGVHEHILDFEIVPTDNPKTLIFVDSSTYMKEPERPLLEVTLPGYNKYFLTNIIARRVNTFNSNTLGLTHLLNYDCLIDLPDGIYKFRYKVCPYKYVFIDKFHMRTTLLEQRLSCLYLKLNDTDCVKAEDMQNKRDIIEINILLEGAKSVVNKDQKKAYNFYQLASKLLERVNSKLCKDCS